MIIQADCFLCGGEKAIHGRYLTCTDCGRSSDHYLAQPVRCTSADLAVMMQAADRRWLRTKLRKRVARYGCAAGMDHAGIWRARFMARAVSLAAYWGRNWKERMAR